LLEGGAALTKVPELIKIIITNTIPNALMPIF